VRVAKWDILHIPVLGFPRLASGNLSSSSPTNMAQICAVVPSPTMVWP